MQKYLFFKVALAEYICIYFTEYMYQFIQFIYELYMYM
jgi:hypothetical protein